MKHIYLDNYFLLYLLIIILTGNFNGFIPYFLLLLIHELGHAITGIILGYKLDKIVFYPLGGVTKFNLPLNIPLNKELLIIIMGPFMQIIGFFFLKNYFPFITIYHYTLLVFNLLPLYPLDGGRIISIILGYHFNYLTCFYLTLIISIVMILILICLLLTHFNLNILLMIILIISKLYQLYKKRFYYYNRFLLERYLYDYQFNKIINIHSIKEFYRDRKHFLNFVDEKNYLKKYFKEPK